MKPLRKEQITERIAKVALSPIFTFLVGKDQTPISIHADVVKNIFAPLDAMINNGVMIESTTRVAILDDVEVEVFQKFCQFAYTGDYTIDEIDPDKEDKGKDLAGTTAQMKPDTEEPQPLTTTVQRRHRKLHLQAHPMNSSG